MNIMKNWKHNYDKVLKEVDKKRLLDDYIYLASYLIDLDVHHTKEEVEEFNSGLNYKV